MRPPQVLREGTKKTIFVNLMDLCKIFVDIFSLFVIPSKIWHCEFYEELKRKSFLCFISGSHTPACLSSKVTNITIFLFVMNSFFFNASVVIDKDN